VPGLFRAWRGFLLAPTSRLPPGTVAPMLTAEREGATKSGAGTASGERRWHVWADRWGPWILAAGLCVVLYGLAMGRARTIGGYFDQAYFRNAAWLLARGESPYVAFRGLPFLGDHFSPIMWVEALPTLLLPAMAWLLALQAAALASGVVFVVRTARRHAGLPVVAALALGVAYVLYPAVSNVAVADFHPEVVAVPALFGAVWFALGRRWLPYAACLTVALLAKEDLAIVVAMVGLFVAVFLGERGIGLVTLAVGAVWFVVVTQLVIPSFAGAYIYGDLFPGWGDGLGSISLFAVTHPVTVLRTLATTQNFLLLLALFAPLLFLPVAAPRWLLPVVPTLLLLMLAARPSMHTVEAQYTVALIPFVFFAAAFGMSGLWPGADRDGPPLRATVALVLAAAVCLGAFSIIDPRTTLVRTATDVARQEAAAMVPPDATVSADEADWYWIADRRRFYGFPYPFGPNPLGERYRDPLSADDARAETDWILVDTTDEHWNDSAEAELGRIIDAHGFTERFSRDGVRLYSRDPAGARQQAAD